MPQKFFPGSESSEPHIRLPSLGLWQWEKKPPEKLALKTSGVYLQELHRTRGKRNFTLGGHAQGPVSTRPQGKKQTGPDLPACIGESPDEAGSAVAHCRDKDAGGSGFGMYSLAWALPAACSLQCWKASDQASTLEESQLHSSEDKQTKVLLSMALPTRGTRPSSTHHQSLPSGCQHKPLSLIHQRAQSTNTKNYNPAARGTETPITES